MYEAFLVTFRESLEMALIVGIILAYLKRTAKTKWNNTVYLGVVSGVVVSLVLAYAISAVWGSFEGVAEEIFEGVIMLTAGFLLTTMIFWFFKQQKSVRMHIEKKLEAFWDRWSVVGLFGVVFLSVLREGVETVLFMSAVILNNPDNLGIAMGGFSGIFVALFLGYLLFVVEKRINLKWFFRSSNVLLILFAAGLFAHGIHELQEAHLIPIYIEHLFDVNHLLDEKSALGSIMKGLFGYNGNPSLIETLTYLGYLGMVGLSFHHLTAKKV